MKTNEKEVVFVGVDVSKDSLDVYRPDTGENIKIQNTEVDINGLFIRSKKLFQGNADKFSTASEEQWHVLGVQKWRKLANVKNRCLEIIVGRSVIAGVNLKQHFFPFLDNPN